MVSEHAFAELGLAAGASDQEVKTAWRRLMSLWHPDRNASREALAKVQRINQAFEAIRQARDGDMARSPAPGPTAPAAEAPSPAPQTAQQAPTGRPIRRRLRLSLEEAAAGCIKLVRGRRTPQCTACDGLGHRVLAADCPTCRGSGSVVRGSLWFGWSTTTEPCADCGASGRARRGCTPCGGSGRLAAQNYEVQVRIPPGVRDGDLLHAAASRARRRPAPADLEIEVAVAPHALFRLQADGDLHCELPVDGFAWIAQREAPLPTLQGLQPLALVRGQRRHSLAGLGFPRSRGGPCGDLHVDIVPVFPERFSTDQQILFDQLLATTAGGDAPPRLREWQSALRQWQRQRAQADPED